jgi:glucosamine--fructose-6-phosphate aminotransferase (isomerizing)
MAGEQTRTAVFAQPQWLAGVPERVGALRYPEGRVLFTGCGTSYHAALAAARLARGEARQAFDLSVDPRRADIMVVVSHSGATAMSVAAARAFDGPVWVVTGAPASPLADLAEEVILAAPEVEVSWCHTASYTAGVAALDALAGNDVSWLPAAVEEALRAPVEAFATDRVLIAGMGPDWATAQEAALKLREGVFLPAESYHTEQLLHGHLAAVDESYRAFLLEGEDERVRERTADAARALGELGVETTILPARHPALDVVPFHLLVLALAERRGVNPDRIHRDDERWAKARAAYS